ncbi:MAG: hypothetical protein OEV44_02025 [Spirochaetota bacterium]|nr:hypothetical protein [Spirochaetota bacterium]
MIQLTRVQQTLLFVGLVAILFITRGHHAPLGLTLPDATLATFFIGGVFLRSSIYMIGMFIIAGLVDYLAFSSGVSTFCITTATGSISVSYLFLIPAYAVMWFAGEWFRKINREKLSSLGILGLVLFSSTLIAFIISDYSFYFFSGKFDGVNLNDYTQKIISVPGYLSGYFGYTFLYVSLAVLIYTISTKLHKVKSKA